ncbi:General stress protein A [Rosistilla carotiformis]|uniref:General stress protein A n=1 Tax=Rosistilla carotiformis TaxID=2528017 RepID=A0A518K139_9BACT|nr:glycosyltransferase family 8 protein [Rosistilla carotiformis]QDV71508.1 General stress protein A [Rosistilla carotiformis]
MNTQQSTAATAQHAPPADRSDATIDVVCAADDAYAMPLAVTLKSACRNLAKGSRIRLFFITGGINDANWSMIEATLADEPIDIHVIQPDRAIFADLTISHHISHTAYFRLLTAELLPSDVRRVIYLDSDLFIQEDLGHLWALPIEANFCLATVDVACPYVDARLGCANYRMANPYMASLSPIRNYRELGLDGSSEYFNSGVMVLNLDLWRKEEMATRLLKTLRDNQKYVWCWDQYALNVACHGNWGRFDPRWNQGAHVFEYPSARHAPIEVNQWDRMRTDPAIVHFTTEFKPWQHNSNHPRSEVFYEGLDETAWRGWRPDTSRSNFKDWFNRQVLAAIKQATISSRRLTSMWAAG